MKLRRNTVFTWRDDVNSMLFDAGFRVDDCSTTEKIDSIKETNRKFCVLTRYCQVHFSKGKEQKSGRILSDRRKSWFVELFSIREIRTDFVFFSLMEYCCQLKFSGVCRAKLIKCWSCFNGWSHWKICWFSSNSMWTLVWEFFSYDRRKYSR